MSETRGILAAEKQTYGDIWQIARYAVISPGAQAVEVFLDTVRPPATVLDAGTGSGKGALALQQAGFTVALCDLTGEGLVPEARAIKPFFETCLWHDLTPLPYLAHVANGTFPEERFDWVYCCDVLEHLPTQFVGLAVSRMLEVAKDGLFLSVCTGYDRDGVWVGKPLHQTVQPFVWWRDTLRELGTVTDARDCHLTAYFTVHP